MKSNWYKASGSNFWRKLFRGDRRVMSSEERIAFLLSIRHKFTEFHGDDAVAYNQAKDLIEDPQTGVDVLRLIAEDERLPGTIKNFIFNNPNMNEDLLSILINKYDTSLSHRAALSPKATDAIFKIIVARWLRENSERNYWLVKYAVINPVVPAWFLSYVARSHELVPILVESVKDNKIRLEDMPYDVLFSMAMNKDLKFVEESKEFKDLCFSLIKDRAMERVNRGTVSYNNADFDRVNKMMNETKEYGGNDNYVLTLGGHWPESVKAREEYLSELTSVAVNPSTPEKVLLMMIKNSTIPNGITSLTYFPKLIGMNSGASTAVLKSLIVFDASSPQISGLSDINDNEDLKRLVFTHPNFTREVYDLSLKSIFEDPKTQMPYHVAALLADSKLTTTKDIEYIMYNLEEIMFRPHTGEDKDFIRREHTVEWMATPFVKKFIYDARLMGVFNNLFKKGMNKDVRWARLSASIISKRLAWVKSKFSGTPKAAMGVRGV